MTAESELAYIRYMMMFEIRVRITPGVSATLQALVHLIFTPPSPSWVTKLSNWLLRL